MTVDATQRRAGGRAGRRRAARPAAVTNLLEVACRPVVEKDRLLLVVLGRGLYGGRVLEDRGIVVIRAKERIALLLERPRPLEHRLLLPLLLLLPHFLEMLLPFLEILKPLLLSLHLPQRLLMLFMIVPGHLLLRHQPGYELLFLSIHAKSWL